MNGMAKISREEMIRLNPGIKMVFGRTHDCRGYLVLFSALDFRNLTLPKEWEINAKNGLTNKHYTSGPYTSYPVFIKNVLVAGPKINIDEKTDKAVIYRP